MRERAEDLSLEELDLLFLLPDQHHKGGWYQVKNGRVRGQKQGHVCKKEFKNSSWLFDLENSRKEVKYTHEHAPQKLSEHPKPKATARAE